MSRMCQEFKQYEISPETLLEINTTDLAYIMIYTKCKSNSFNSRNMMYIIKHIIKKPKQQLLQ